MTKKCVRDLTSATFCFENEHKKKKRLVLDVWGEHGTVWWVSPAGGDSCWDEDGARDQSSSRSLRDPTFIIMILTTSQRWRTPHPCVVHNTNLPRQDSQSPHQPHHLATIRHKGAMVMLRLRICLSIWSQQLRPVTLLDTNVRQHANYNTSALLLFAYCIYLLLWSTV